MKRYAFPIVFSLLTACATGPRYSALPPVVDNSSQADASASGEYGGDGVQTFPLPDAGTGDAVPLPDGSVGKPIPLPDTAPRARPTNNAVVALLDRADDYSRGGDNDAAAASLERALRIEPRNAELWSRLAAIRLEQGQPDQAEQLALKSNSLSPRDARLQARNWDTVARARWARNDSIGAQAAEARADALRKRL
jgi:tetratricopeptide (TPR) repeat protein